MKKIIATFIGTNSLGYVHGKKYELSFRQYVNSPLIKILRVNDGKGNCEYSNTINFFENWNEIITL